MNQEIFEVSRDEYVGFVDQINPAAKHSIQIENEDCKSILTYSNKTNKLLCQRDIFEDDGVEQYYVFEMPDDDERREPPCKRKIVLNTKEEVQLFMDFLSQASKKNDGIV